MLIKGHTLVLSWTKSLIFSFQGQIDNLAPPDLYQKRFNLVGLKKNWAEFYQAKENLSSLLVSALELATHCCLRPLLQLENRGRLDFLQGLF